MNRKNNEEDVGTPQQGSFHIIILCFFSALETLDFKCYFSPHKLLPLTPCAAGPLDQDGHIYPRPAAAVQQILMAELIHLLLGWCEDDENGGEMHLDRRMPLSCSGFIACCILLSFGIWIDFTAYEFIMLSVSLHGVQTLLHCETKRSTSALLTASRWKLFLQWVTFTPVSFFSLLPLWRHCVSHLCCSSPGIPC